MITKNNQTTFFSSVRTTHQLKKEVQKTLSQLGLTWGTFVNNGAKKLITEKKVTFQVRDENGFTPEKAKEIQKALEDAKAGKGLQGPMTVEETLEHLENIK